MFEVLQQVPWSTLFLFGIAGIISLLTSLVNRLLTNPEKAKADRKEISEWNTELRKAQKAGDKKTVDKLMKKQQQIMKLQSRMMWQSMKVTLLFLVPLLLVWQFLGGIFRDPTGQAINVAYFPGVGPVLPIPIIGNMISLIWWYLLSSFLFGTVFSHLFGLVEVSE